MLKNNRIAYWDNIKAFLIILVVFGHFLNGIEDKARIFDYLHDAIYMFHMPAFIFVSGYFSKSENSKSKRSLLKLFWGYILFNAVFFLFALIEGNNLKIITPYYSAWYLLSLIFWRLTVRPISKFRYPVATVTLAALLVGYSTEISNILSLRRTVAFYPFFLLGYMLSKEKAEKIIQVKLKTKVLLGCGVLLIGGVLETIGHKVFRYTDSQMVMGIYRDSIKQCTARASLFIIAAVIILGLLILTPNKDLGIYSKIGRNTLSVFLAHRPIVYLTAKIMKDINHTGVLFAISIIGTIILSIILGSDKFNGAVNKLLDSLTNKCLAREQE